MKKVDIKKVLMYISFIPYILFIINCLKIKNSYDLCNDIDCLIRTQNKIFFQKGSVIIILLLCLIYQIYYIISKKVLKIKINNKKINIKIKKVLFILSLVWIALYLVLVPYYSFTIVMPNYGSDSALGAMVLGYIVLFIFVPITPISLIYIIIYLIVRYREKRKKNNENVNSEN